MAERVMLFRPLTGELLHPEVEWETGEYVQRLNEPGSIDLTLPISWRNMVDHHGRPMLEERKTLVVVGAGEGRNNMSIDQIGLVDSALPVGNRLQVSCGGLSMLPGQAGPWEGHQGYFVTMDVLRLFYRIIEWSQSYPDANVGLEVIGDTRTGTALGYPGSARWQNAQREFNRLKPQLDKAEAHLLNAERVLASRAERVFRAAYLKRVGTITQQENPPDDPGFKADSTIWVNNAWRAHRWRDGTWVSQSQADDAVHGWRNAVATRDRARDAVEPLKYQLEPIEEQLEEYEDEAKEEFSMYFWQNHSVQPTFEELMELGPFEYRETGTWRGERLIPQIEVRTPKIGVRRNNIRLEIDVNVLDYPPMERGETYTGLTLFGAGEGSEILSTQRSWKVQDAVRNIHVEVDKEAHTKSLTRSAASKLERELRKAAGLGFTRLLIHHDRACPEGSFMVGDEIPVTGRLVDGTERTEWVRVLSASREMGSKKTEVEVEAV